VPATRASDSPAVVAPPATPASERVPKRERSAADFGTHWSTNRARMGPATMTVGMAMMMPKISVRPRSASRSPMAVSGPGCGGTRPCSTDSPASAGMPTFMSDSPVRCATRMTTGTSRTTPTSKNSGRPRIAAIAAMTHGRPPGPTRPTMDATMRLAPPESSRSLPIIAPRAMRMPTAPAVVPNPVTKLFTVSPGGIVATAPSTAEPSMRARKGWTLAHVMSTTTARMPSTHASTSCALPAYTGGGSSAKGSAVAAVADHAAGSARSDIRRAPFGVRARRVPGPGPGPHCPRW
jgi:hypothetical protein